LYSFLGIWIVQPIFFDTSSLPRNPQKPSQAFALLLSLVEANEAQVVVSELAIREWTTQFAIELEQLLKEANSKLKSLARNPIFKAQTPEVHKQTADELSTIDYAKCLELAEQAVDRFIEQFHVRVVPIEHINTDGLWDAYFAGEPPFATRKERKDIPDYIICSTAKTLGDQLGDIIMPCVVNDGRLSDAIASHNKLQSYSKLDDLLKSAFGQELFKKSERTTLWQQHKDAILSTLRDRQKWLQGKIAELITELLPQYAFLNDEIPSTNGKAAIGSVESVSNTSVNFDAVIELAPGWLHLSYSTECDIGLEFTIDKSEEQSMPAWVDMMFSDSPVHGCSTAFGVRRIRAVGDLLIEYSLDQLRQNSWDNPQVEAELRFMELLPFTDSSDT
jgi:hypothetical protein